MIGGFDFGIEGLNIFKYVEEDIFLFLKKIYIYYLIYNLNNYIYIY